MHTVHAMRINHGVLATLATVLVICCMAVLPANADENVRVYIGTYTRGDSEGIYQLELNRESGVLGEPVLAGATENPSFLALHPERPVLYAAGEMSDGGTVSAFAIDAASGTLKPLNQQSAEGRGPCHVSIAPDGKQAAVANYGSGNVALYPLAADGQLGKVSGTAQHSGSSVNERRQDGPHAHSVNFDAAGRFLVAADLGIDKLLVYQVEDGSLTPNDPAFAAVAPGAGPRHFAFHPDGELAYVVNELDSTINAFRYDAERGKLDSLQTIGTLPDDFDGDNTTAEIRVHPSGKYVYASNRGDDSIAAFKVDPELGVLTAIGHESSGGETPRNFNIGPSGEFLLAANQKSDNVVVLRVDPETGALSETEHSVSIPSPVCVVFVPRDHPAHEED